MKNLKIFIGTIVICILTTIALTGCDDLLKLAGQEDITITKKYTVTFDSDGGSTVPAQEIIKDNCATEPKDPTKDNNIFAGWYPMWQCNPDSRNGGFEAEAAIALASCETIQRELIPKMIMAKPEDFESIWAEYISQMTPRISIHNKF